MSELMLQTGLSTGVRNVTDGRDRGEICGLAYDDVTESHSVVLPCVAEGGSTRSAVRNESSASGWPRCRSDEQSCDDQRDRDTPGHRVPPLPEFAPRRSE